MGELSWTQPRCFRIGRALLDEEGHELDAQMLAKRTGQRNIKRLLDAMAGAGLLETRTPAPIARAGRPTTVTYGLGEAGVQAVRELLQESPSEGLMLQGHQLVFVGSSGDTVARLFEALDASTALARAAWFAVCDGEPQELAVLFAGANAYANAFDFMSELRGADLSVRRTAITSLGLAEELAEQAHRSARAARRARMGRATREAAAG